MPFQGFDSLKYPEYSVITPQGGLSFRIRSMNVSETSKVRGSFVTPAEIMRVVNSVLWECIVEKPKYITNYDIFKRSVTMIDRDAILFALYQSTFGDDRELIVTCDQCRDRQNINVRLSNMFSMNAYPFSDAIISDYTVSKIIDSDVSDPDIDKEIEKKESKSKKSSNKDNKDKNEDEDKDEDTKDILKRRVRLRLDPSYVDVVIKQPTVNDDENIMDSSTFSNQQRLELAMQTLIIDRFEEYEGETQKLKSSVTSVTDIMLAYQKLPDKYQKLIYNKYQEEFGQYAVEVKTEWPCKKCKHQNTLSLDIQDQFFQTILAR